MTRTRFVGAVVAILVLGGAGAIGEPPSYPAGYSVQNDGERTFEIVVPAKRPPSSPCSLVVLVSVNGSDDVAKRLEGLAADGYVVCAPKTRFLGIKGMGSNWAANEAPELVKFTDRIAKQFEVPEARLHIVGITDWAGFLPLVAFSKESRFASVCFASGCVYRGGSVPDRAKVKTGVLVLGKAPIAEVPRDQRIEPMLSGKVRTFEFRSDEKDVGGPYFRYWIGVMEERFTPGYDLSLDWLPDGVGPPAAGPAPPPAAAPAGPAAPLALLDTAMAQSKARRAGALVYFYAAEDAAKPEAKDLQNDVFFDPDVRAAAKSVVTVKLDRARYGDAFTAFGLKTTPAVVVVDAGFRVLDRFGGDIKAKALEKALRRAAAPPGKTR